MNIVDLFFKAYNALRDQPEIPVQGPVAHDAAAVGNPLRMGGVYHSADPAASDGDIVDMRVNAKGEVLMQLSGSNVEQTLNAALPAKANLMGISDGVNIQAMKGNASGTLLASAARTVTTAIPNQDNLNAKGVIVVLKVTANPGGVETLQVKLRPVTPLGAFEDYIIFPAFPAATNSVRYYVVYPGAVETIASNYIEATAMPIPKVWAGAVIHSSTGSWTYSLEFMYIL